MRQRVKEGKPLYGESSLDDHIQQYAARFSRYAALNFGTFIDNLWLIYYRGRYIFL